MISRFANSFLSEIRRLSNRCCYFNKRSCGQRTSNLAFFFVRKRHTIGMIGLVLTNIVVVALGSLLIPLAMANIVL